MGNLFYDVQEVLADAKAGRKDGLRLPSEEELRMQFAKDCEELSHVLNRLSSCTVAMALKRKQLYWEDVWAIIEDDKDEECFYSPQIRSEILKGKSTLYIAWMHIARARSDKGKHVFSTQVKLDSAPSIRRKDFPLVGQRIFKRIVEAEREFRRIIRVFRKLNAIRAAFSVMATEFNRAQEERKTDNPVKVKVEPISAFDGER